MRIEPALLALSGLLFLAFPLLRPYGDSSADPRVVAQTFASSSWVAAHVLGMLAFVLLPLGLHGLTWSSDPRQARFARLGFLLCAIGSGLVAAFFGAEAFGLQSIGQLAIREGRSDALDLANALRLGPAIVVMTAGLLAVSLGTILCAIAVRRSSSLLRWSAAVLAAGVFLWGIVLAVWPSLQWLRIAEALLITVASFGVAIRMGERAERVASPLRGSS
jgi:hypothetical protein